MPLITACTAIQAEELSLCTRQPVASPITAAESSAPTTTKLVVMAMVCMDVDGVYGRAGEGEL